MATNSVKTNNGKGIMIYRSFTPNGSLSNTERLPPTKFRIGINTTTPTIASTALDVIIPIEDGTVNDDGSNQMTGSSGGDNTTDNTSVYKPGAGLTDATAQNLIANNTSATKIWTISNLASNGTNIDGTKFFSIWFYIKDTTALNKFLSSGTALEIKFGSDSSNYYSITKTASQLSTGWNFISSLTQSVDELTETGTVSGNIDTFIIEITTNNSTDEFVAGDVVYDLLRTWDSSDNLGDFVASYPTFDYTNFEVTTRILLNSAQANGFDIDGLELRNQDTTPLTDNIHEFTAQSKSDNEEFVFIVKERLI